MDVGPDGSLCPITSSAKDIVCNVKIVKISENEPLDTNEPEYKLVFIGEEEYDFESLSEESDEDAFEKELFHKTSVILSTENNEKDKDVKVQEVIENPKNDKKKFHKKIVYDEKFRSSNVHQGRKNYKSFGKGNFSPSGSVYKTYNRSKANTSSQNINPWILQHPRFGGLIVPYGNVSDYIYQQYPGNVSDYIYQQYPSSAEPIVKKFVTPGRLSDSPSNLFHRPSFQSSYQSTPYGHGQNFGKIDYSSSYQTAPNRQSSRPPLNYQNKHRKRKNWKRNLSGNQQKRRNNKTYFSY